ncbi:MAG: efflux RND transporter periplasmic adaptor subunit, partial [Bacteroidetes bacterium]
KDADAGAGKNLEKSASEFQSLEARLAGLRQQLKLLNIPTDKLSPSTLSSRVEVRAPFSGYITEVYVNMGTYVAPQEGICELVDRSHLHLELQIFDKDIARVREGQKLSAIIGGKEYSGFVKTVGQKVDEETHTLGVHAHIEEESAAIKPGVYASVRLWTEGETLPAVPESAILTEEDQHYVYLREGKDTFRRMHVHTGASAGGFTALETRLPDGAQVVVAGAASLHTKTE